MRKYIILYIMFSCLSLVAQGQDIISDSLLSEVLPPPIQAHSLHYWFDSDTDNMQAVDGLSGNYVLDVTSLTDGLHTIHYQVIGADGQGYGLTSCVFLKMSESIEESVNGNKVKANRLHYWFDSDTDNMQAVDGLSGNYVLDVTSLSDGLHTIHYQVIGADGQGYGLTSCVFLKMFESIEESLIGSQVKASQLRYWFDGETDNIQTIDGTSGNYILNVKGLSGGQHTLYYQVIGDDGKAYGFSSAEFEKMVYRFKLTYIVDEEEYKTDSIAYDTAIEAEPFPQKEGYSFSGWNELPDTMPAHDVTVNGSFVINKYKLIYILDGDTLQSDSVIYATDITPIPEQVREGYTFSGWSELPDSMPAHDVTVTGSFAINSYKLTYIVDGEEYKTDSVIFATELNVVLLPEKEGHTFSGWSGIPETMPAHDVAVTGSFAINTYMLRYYVDGEPYDSLSITFGEAIVPVAEPMREGESFSGWLGVPETMPAHDVTVAGTFATDKYLASFIVDGEVLKTDSVTFGFPITSPTPEREGYTFSGWSEIPATMPAHDVTIEGSFSINSYKLTYIVDGEEYKADSVVFATELKPLAEPKKEGYTFNGWSEVPATMPAHDVTITGLYVINSYKLNYIVDGEEYKTDSVTFATPLTSLENPEKEGYTFSGWSEVPATMPAHDVTVTGTFAVNSYILRYYVDGEPYDSLIVAYGQAITPIVEPTREGETFSGWIGVPETMPANDVTIAGTFSTDKYLVSFIIDGEVLKADSVTFGLPIEAPTPEREGYTFSGWSEMPATMPSKDVTITGSFIINSYKLTYIVDGKEVQIDSVTYDTTLTPLPEPTKEGYTFSGWSEVPATMPSHDIVVTGTFSINPTYIIDDVVLSYNEEKGGYIFAGTNNPEAKEVTIPKEMNGIPVVSVPEATFAGNTQLQVLIWDSEAPVDAACFGTPEEHGNLLVFVSGDVEVTYQGNVIRNGVAKSITLYDGRPFSNPQAFTAENISISKKFEKETIINSTSGWETFVVPFEVDSITAEDGQLIAPFGADANTDKHFWLAKMDANVGFTKDSLIRANIPYIISMPNSEGYIEEYRINGKVTFHGRNVVVQPTANATSNAGPLFGLVPTYQEVAAADSVFVLNDEPYEADGITWPAGSVFVRSSRAARPFEAYTYANASNGGNVKGYIRIDELANGIQRPTPAPSRNGGEAGAMYDLSGRKISVSSVHSASSVLPKGVYIMDGQKVLVK